MNKVLIGILLAIVIIFAVAGISTYYAPTESVTYSSVTLSFEELTAENIADFLETRTYYSPGPNEYGFVGMFEIDLQKDLDTLRVERDKAVWLIVQIPENNEDNLVIVSVIRGWRGSETILLWLVKEVEFAYFRNSQIRATFITENGVRLTVINDGTDYWITD